MLNDEGRVRGLKQNKSTRQERKLVEIGWNRLSTNLAAKNKFIKYVIVLWC